jgi:hypothetical protein
VVELAVEEVDEAYEALAFRILSTENKGLLLL